MNHEEARTQFGRRVQRCYGCYVAFHLKDMWLGENATFYCMDCKNDSMFHFDEFSRKLDLARLPSLQTEDPIP